MVDGGVTIAEELRVTATAAARVNTDIMRVKAAAIRGRLVQSCRRAAEAGEFLYAYEIPVEEFPLWPYVQEMLLRDGFSVSGREASACISWKTPAGPIPR